MRYRAAGDGDPVLASDDTANSFLETRPNPRGNDPPVGWLDVGGTTRAARAQQPLEIQGLLHHRLRIIALIGLVGIAFFDAFRFLRLELTPDIIRLVMVPAALYLAVLTVMTVILWRKHAYTLARLRWIEGLLFGITTLYFIDETYTPFFVEPGWWFTYSQRHPSELSFLARHPSTYWMTLIVVYGTFIPNTGRRCAAVTSAMALAPLTVVGVAGSLTGVLSTRLLVLVLSEMFMWLAVGVAIAIYGSHKISVLREEALAARKLGQYQLKKQIGCGGMGEVYLAEHVLLKRPCAVKVIRHERAGDPRMLERFLREVQATAALTHPNTVQVFDYGQGDDGTVFYAMEYLTGLSLKQLVERYDALSPGRTIFILHQLCGALAEAHRVGLIHRDIKPSNVLLCSRGGLHDVAKLLDFGLARIQSADPRDAGLTQAGVIFGTPDYMSPEQATGKESLDARSDVYSLGALAYFLLAARPPFARDSVVQTLAAHISDPVEPLRSRRPDLSGDLEAVVLRCLCKDPEARFPDVTALEQALASCGSAGEWTQREAADWWSATSSTPPRPTC